MAHTKVQMAKEDTSFITSLLCQDLFNFNWNFIYELQNNCNSHLMSVNAEQISVV
jgi:hypothetical protein